MVDHVDAEVLALVALGEPVDDTTRAHLDTCAACTQEVSSLAAVVAVGRSVTTHDTLVAPPPAVWDRIRADLGLRVGAPDRAGHEPVAGSADRSGPAPGPDGAAPLVGAAAAGVAAPDTSALAAGTPDAAALQRAAVPDRGTPGTPGTQGAGGTEGAGSGDGTEDTRSPGATVVPLRRRMTGWIAAAAASGLVVGGAAGVWWIQRTGPDDGPGEVLAEAALEPLPGWTSSGAARVEESPGGGRVLVVSLEGEEAEDGYQEVWLIDREVSRLVSLGVLTGSEGRFTVPPGLDLSEFPVVDVSDEPVDGDPAHSGDSIIRGILDA